MPPCVLRKTITFTFKLHIDAATYVVRLLGIPIHSQTSYSIAHTKSVTSPSRDLIRLSICVIKICINIEPYVHRFLGFPGGSTLFLRLSFRMKAFRNESDSTFTRQTSFILYMILQTRLQVNQRLDSEMTQYCIARVVFPWFYTSSTSDKKL